MRDMSPVGPLQSTHCHSCRGWVNQTCMIGLTGKDRGREWGVGGKKGERVGIVGKKGEMVGVVGKKGERVGVVGEYIRCTGFRIYGAHPDLMSTNSTMGSMTSPRYLVRVSPSWELLLAHHLLNTHLHPSTQLSKYTTP